MYDKFTDYGGVPRATVPPGIDARTQTNRIPPLIPPPATADMARVVQVPTPELVPPAGSVNVVQQVQANTVGVADAQALAAFAVPENAVFIVKAVDLFIDDLVQATNIVFTCFENGSPIPGYESIVIFPGVAARASKTLDQTVLRIHPSALFTIRAVNNDGGAHLIGAGFQGYHMPENIYKQYGGQPF